MAGFLYYLPGAISASAEELKARGLDDRVDEHVSYCECDGPDGTHGVICTVSKVEPGGASPAARYSAGNGQVWEKASDGDYWIGFNSDDRPAPEDLARGADEQIQGHTVEMLDGQEWLVPCARVFPQGSALPSALVLGPEGEVIREPLEKFAGFSKRMERVWSALEVQMGWREGSDDEADALDDTEGFANMAEALSLNYRIGAREISMLRLASNVTMTRVLLAAVDFPTVKRLGEEMRAEEIEKKKAGSGE